MQRMSPSHTPTTDLLYAVNQSLALLSKVCMLLVACKLLDLCQGIRDQLSCRLVMRHAGCLQGVIEDTGAF